MFPTPPIRPHEQKACWTLLVVAVLVFAVYRCSFGTVEVLDLRRGRPAADYRLAVDANHAPWTEFELLPGIGPTLAQRIVQCRIERGVFRDIEDLLNVKGIGPRKLEQLRPFVTLDSPTSPKLWVD